MSGILTCVPSLRLTRLPVGLLVPILAAALAGSRPAGAEGPQENPEEPTARLEGITTEISSLMGRFQKLVAEFRKAAPQRKQEIRQEALALRAQLRELSSKALELFPPVYRKDPDDPVVTSVLPDMLTLYLQHNRFPEVIRYGEPLLEAGEASGGTARAVGIALFAEHRFDRAAGAFEEARKKGQLSKRGAAFLESARKYGDLWAAEKKIRAREKDAGDLPRVRLETTRGEIELELFENEAPGTVGSFVSLVEKGFYEGTSFHRVIPNFMAQGGDPNTLDDNPRNDGQGGPGYTIPCECYREDARKHFAGSLSMAHAGRDTGGSQFFLTHVPTPHLNGKHTVFGRVLSGLPVVRSLEVGDEIIEAEVTRKRDHAYAPPGSATGGSKE